MDPPATARRAALLFLLLAALAWLAVQRGWVEVPPRHNPWAPLDLEATPNWLTGWKLSRATADDARCMQVLEQAAMAWVDLPDRVTGPGCGFSNAVRIDRTRFRVGEPFPLTCRAAVSLALWEAHVLEPAAREHLGSDLVAIEHYGSYACRNVYGRETGRRSQHATADALDVAGFRFSDGRRVRVLADWDARALVDGEASPEARFLLAAHRGACRFFDAVLGPEYNRAHADHFHVDRGGFRACR